MPALERLSLMVAFSSSSTKVLVSSAARLASLSTAVMEMIPSLPEFPFSAPCTLLRAASMLATR